jgi:hypothetical protein
MSDDPAKPRGRVEPSLFKRAQGIKGTLERLDPIWGPLLIVAGAIVLDVSLPEKLTLGPNWLLPGLEAVLLLGLLIASPHPRLRHSPLRRRIAISLVALVSATNIVSLYLLTHFLLHHGTTQNQGRPLILAGIVLWVTNVLLFGLWYWELDRGGPVARATDPPGEAGLPVPADDAGAAARPTQLDAGADRLPLCVLHERDGVQPDGHDAPHRDRKAADEHQALALLLTIGLVVARAVNILR